MNHKKRVLLHSALPLLASLGIYVLFRPRNTIVNKLLFQFMTTKPPMLRLTYGRWIVQSLPGALWLYSFLNFSALPTRRLLSLLPLAMALGIEVLQYLHITDGRFDWLDVVCYLAAYLVFSGLQWWWHSPPLPDAPRPRLTRRYKLAYGFFIGIVLLSDVWFK